MILSPPVRSAVLEVVRQLRDPDRHMNTDSIGWMIACELGLEAYRDTVTTPLAQIREALGVSNGTGSLAHWARGKSRAEVARALEAIATTPCPTR
jgi:hypothetical protein